MNLPRQRIESIEAEMDAAGVREVYDIMVARGEHPNMAAMLAMQKAPGTWNTDTDFSRRENDRMRSMDQENMDAIIKIAKRAGINTHGKTYNGQLGRYDDPYAWVSSTGDVKSAALAKGMDIDGMVRVNGYRGPKKKVRLASDIIDSLEASIRKSDPKVDEKCRKSKVARRELREQIVEKHSKPKE